MGRAGAGEQPWEAGRDQDPNRKQVSVDSDSRERVRRHKQRPETSVLCAQTGRFCRHRPRSGADPPVWAAHKHPCKEDRAQSEKAELHPGEADRSPRSRPKPGTVADTQGNQVPACTLGGVSLQKTRRAGRTAPGKRRETPSAPNMCPVLPKLPSSWALGPSAGLRAGAAGGDRTPKCNAASRVGHGQRPGAVDESKGCSPDKARPSAP